MLHNTLGIVLNTINYNDKYFLVKIYTRDFGSATYSVPKNHTKSSNVKRMLFQPLAVLRLIVDHQNNKDIHRIKDATVEDHTYQISTDMSKTAIAFFLSEFLSKVLKEPNRDNHLFDFIRDSIALLECKQRNIANFHLVFLLRLSYFLGFYPNFDTYKHNSFFDMQNGEFVSLRSIHNNILTAEESKIVALVGRMNFRNMECFKFNRQQRNELIQKILFYYKIHTSNSLELKTLDVLQELF